jgi:hypothetical protein
MSWGVTTATDPVMGVVARSVGTAGSCGRGVTV